MEYISIKPGDILNATEDYIAHQCNCLSTQAKGLALDIFKKYPHANSYARRVRDNYSTYSKPGTIEILVDEDNKKIINLYAQYYPGKPQYKNDNPKLRIRWFTLCLKFLLKIKDIQNKTIAMPYKIGCNLAGGDWEIYYDILKNFCEENKVNIVLYKKD